MAQDFFSSITSALGGGRISSGYRSPEEQRRLLSAGVTRAQNSAHTHGTPDNPGAVDITGIPGGDPDSIRRRLTEAGIPVRKVIWETGKGKNQGTGAHYHAEFGSAPAPAPRNSNVTIQPNEVRQMNQGDKFEIVNPFEAGNKLATQQTTLEQRGNALDNLLTGITQELQAAQPVREEALKDVVEKKSAINNEMTTMTQKLIERARPLWARREEISARENELAQMNPLEKLFKGTFDPRYNSEALRGEDYRSEKELQLMASEYDYMTGLQTKLTNYLDAEYNNQDSVWQLHTANMNQNIELLSKSFGVADQVLGASMEGLNNQMGLLRAQAQARSDTLGQMTHAQVQQAYKEAQGSDNGYAVVNGVPIGLAELQQANVAYEEQNLTLQSRQLALQSQQIGLADQLEDRLISHMTPTQLETAIKNNGQYNGQQLDIGRLTQAYGTLKQQQAARAESIAMNSDVGVMRNNVAAIRNQVTLTTQRMTQMLGTVPDDQRAVFSRVVTEMKAIDEGFKNAQSQGIGAQYIQQVYPRIQALQQLQQKTISDVMKRWAGKDTNLQALGEAWIRGQPVSSDAATQGLITLARGGMPAGMNLQGPMRQVFMDVSKVVAEHDKPKAGQTIDSLTGDKKAQDREFINKVRSTVVKSYQQHLGAEIIKATPGIARKISINGSQHPMSFIDPIEFNAAIQGAQASAREQGKGKSAAEIAALEQRILLDRLDRIQLGPTGVKASKAYVDLLNRPEYQAAAGNIANGAMYSGGLPEYMAGTISGGQINSGLSAYGRSMLTTQQVRSAAILESTTRQAQTMKGDPWTRSKMIMLAQDGVTRQEIDKLLNAVKPMVAANTQGNLVKGAIMGLGNIPTVLPGGIIVNDQSGNMDDAEFHQISSIITSHKFDDPALESIRKKVSSGWTAHQGIIDRALNVFN